VPRQEVLLAVEQQMIGVLFSAHTSKHTRPRQRVGDPLRGLAGRDDRSFIAGA
jgi:hypothetical protein